MQETGCSLAAAATHYNNAKKANPVEGLGRPVNNKVQRKTSPNRAKSEQILPDNECFTVVELVQHDGSDMVVGRCQSFELQGDASEKFDEKVEAHPECTWLLIQGLGPNHGDVFKLEPDEKEIKRHEPVTEEVTC
jgi:hypothetical protein